MKYLTRFFIVLVVFTMCLPRCGYSYEDRSVAVLRVLNKAAGKTQTIRVPVGGTVNVEKISILARSCKQTDPFDAENHFAFIEISESSQGQIFGNWLNRNEPGQNPVQNPDYDVWLLNCE